MIEELSWNEFKVIIDSKNLAVQYVESSNKYEIFAVDGSIEYRCVIYKYAEGSTDQTDFEANYKNNANSPTSVVIKEFDKTPGHYKTKGFSFTALANLSTGYDFSFPYDVEILAGGLWAGNSIQGDQAEFLVAPNTVIGTTTQNHLINDTIISVSKTVIDNIKPGRFVDFVDGQEYAVSDVDKDNLTITISPGLQADITTGSFVRMTIKMVESLHLQPDVHYKLGWTKIGSSYVPKNTTLRCLYSNSDVSDKEVTFWLDVMY